MKHGFLAVMYGLAVMGTAVSAATGQVTPDRLYYGINQAMPVMVDAESAPVDGVELRLLEPRTWRMIESARAQPGKASMEILFPTLWTRKEPSLLYLQAYVDGQALGSALVLQPLLNPTPAVDELTARLRAALNAEEPDKRFAELAALGRATRDRLRLEVRQGETATSTYSGLRVYRDEMVVLETSEGSITLAMRPDAAPNTAFNFLRLVRDQAYIEHPFHRVVGPPPGAAKGAKGFIIQTGDPTGTGEGTMGVCADYEASTLKHTLGTVSMARREDDPNTLSSQFFICLGGEASASLDGRYTAFAEVVDGADAVEAIGTTALGPRNPDDPFSPLDRPLNPPMLHRAFTMPAPPAGRTFTPSDKKEPSQPVDR